MSVLQTILIKDEDDFSTSAQINNKVYLVQTSAMSDGKLAAESAIGVMTPPTDMYLAMMNCERMKDNPLWFKVSVQYKVPPWPGDQSNPLLRAATFACSYNEITEPYFTDFNDPPQNVINKANERFESFPTRRSNKERMTLEITKNYSTFYAVALDLLKNTQNTDVPTIEGTTYAFETLLFLAIRCVKITEQVGITKWTYYAITYRLEADHGLFVDVIQNRGYKQLVGGKRINIQDPSTGGLPPNTPYPLNLDGTMMSDPGDDPPDLSFYPYPDSVWGIDFS